MILYIPKAHYKEGIKKGLIVKGITFFKRELKAKNVSQAEKDFIKDKYGSKYYMAKGNLALTEVQAV